MDISIYQDFFHDGSLIAIDYSKNTNDLTLTMKSAEVDPEELPGTILLSSDDSITGKLHVINIKSIEVNEKPFFGILTKDYDSAEIFLIPFK